MREPEVTREALLSQAGALFNQQGYKATSLSDITAATGLTKGAIYGHFTNKEDLEGQAFERMSGLVTQRITELVRAESTAGAKLRAIFRFFESYVSEPIVAGGCPLQNAAIEADDAHPHLRERALQMLETMRGALRRILENGVRHGQLRADLDCAALSTVMFAALEGAVMMSRLTRSNADICAVNRHLDLLLTQSELHA